MEYIPNTLAEVVTLNLSEDSAVTLVYNLLLCMQYLHSANVVHRDLKPQNILITSDCTVKICDFGFARSTKAPKGKLPGNKRALPMSPVAFTRFYRPPEVILKRKDYDQKADVWSFGCIVSEIIQAVLKKDDQIWKNSKVLFPGKHCYSVSPKVNEDGEVVVDTQE
jgi:serine/threonine protein kinase